VSTDRPAPEVAPPDLEARGVALWDGVVEQRVLGPGERVLLHEACRNADRLDRLAAILSGEDEPWARVVIPPNTDLMRLEVSAALGEARAQQGSMRLTLIALGLERAPGGNASSPADDAKGDPVDEFSRRRADRRNAGPAST
jgi:hypothetical protein